uniref:Integral membrane protein TerC n=1 Tax=Cyanothece sp. (strain PCC 7425 / ATCC 29141) TaxID=395961 RepID=B8HKI3_CYAP4
MNGLELHISVNTGLTLLALIALETVLSADNAVALAAFVQPLSDRKQQQQALNWGLAVAFILRMVLLFAATWIIQFWQVEFAGALYLLWLAGKHFWQQYNIVKCGNNSLAINEASPVFWRIIPLIALTDLAFSLDSVTTAVALSDRLWLVMAGGLIGVVTLRFVAGLFVRWLEQFVYLQDAAYLTVLGVGLRLLCKAVQPDILPPEWIVLTMVGGLFAWGFSKRAEDQITVESALPASVTCDRTRS